MYFIKTTIIVSIIFLLNGIRAAKFDYCSLEDDVKCKNHIACNKNISNSTSVTAISLQIKSKIVKFLNEIKNDFAFGRYRNYKAADMDIVEWDSELEKLAEKVYSIEQTKVYILSDFCIQTESIKENIRPYQLVAATESSVKKLFTTLNGNHKENKHLKTIEDLIPIIVITKIGCVHVNYDADEYMPEKQSAIECFINVRNEGTFIGSYNKGDPCSFCNTVCDSIFTGLCRPNENWAFDV